jgi:hypothetical protein
MQTILMIVVFAITGGSALAADPVEMLKDGTEAQLPEGWQARVRWRDRTLVAFLTAPTVQQSFDLFYDPERGAELVAELCPRRTDILWQELSPDQDVAIEPEVMGKGGLRVSCRATMTGDPPS